MQDFLECNIFICSEIVVSFQSNTQSALAILDILDRQFLIDNKQLLGDGSVKTGHGMVISKSETSLDKSFGSSNDSNSLKLVSSLDTSSVDSKSLKLTASLDVSLSNSVNSIPVKSRVLKANGCEINLGKYLLPGHGDSDSDDDINKAEITKTEVVLYTESLVEEFWDSSKEKWIHPRTGKVLHMQEAIDCGILCPEVVQVKQANNHTVSLQKAINSGQINVHTGKTINLKTALTWPFHVARAKGLVKINDNQPMEKCDMYTELGPGMVSLIAHKEILRETKLLDKRLDQWRDIPKSVDGFVFDTEWGKVKDNMTGNWLTWEEAKVAGLILDPRIGEENLSSDKESTILTEIDKHIVNLTEVIDDKDSKEYGGHILFNQNPAKISAARRPSVDLGDKAVPSMTQRRCSIANDNKAQSATFPIMLDEAIKKKLYNPVTNKLLNPTTNVQIPLEIALQKGLINPESLIRDPVSRDILSLQEAVDKRIIDPESGKMIDANEQAIALNFAFNTGLIMRSQSPLKLSMSEILDEGLFDEELGTFLNPDTNEEITFSEAVTSGLIDKDLVRIRDTESGKVVKFENAVERGLIYFDSGVSVDMANREKVQIPDSIERGILIDIANQPKMSLQCAIEEEVFCFASGTFRDNDLGIEVCLGDAIESGLLDSDSVIVRDPKTLTLLTVDAAVVEGIINPNTGWYSNNGIEIGFGDAVEKGLVVYNASHGVLPCSVLEAVRFNIYDPKSRTFIDPKSGEVVSLEKAIEINLIDPRRTMVKDTSTGRFLSLTNAEYLGVVDMKKSEITNLKDNEQYELKMAKETGLLRRSASEECLSLKTAMIKGLVDERGRVQDSLSKNKVNLADAILIRIIDHTPTLVKDVKKDSFIPLLNAIETGLIDVDSGKFIDTETNNSMTLTNATDIGNIIEIPTSGLTLAEIVEHGLFKEDLGHFLDIRTGKMISLQDGIEQKLIDPSRPQVVVPGTGLFSLTEAFEFGYLDETMGAYLVGGRAISLTEAVEKFFVVTVGSKRRNKSMSDSYCEDMDDGSTWNDLLVKHPTERVFISIEEAVKNGYVDIQTESFCDPITGAIVPLTDAVNNGKIVNATNPRFGLASAFSHGIFDPISNAILDPKSNRETPLNDAMKSGLVDVNRTRVKDLETGKFISLKQALKKGIVSSKTGSLFEKSQKKSYPIDFAVKEKLIVDFTKASFTVPEGIALGLITHDGLMVEDLNTGNYLSFDDAVDRGIIDAHNTSVKHTEDESEMTLAEAIEQNVVDENRGLLKLKTGRRMSLAEAVSKSYIQEKKEVDFCLDNVSDLAMDDSSTASSVAETETSLNRVLSAFFKTDSVSSFGDCRSESVNSPIRFDEALKFGFLDLESGEFTDYLTGSRMSIAQAADEGRLSIKKVSYYDEENRVTIPLKFALENKLLFQASAHDQKETGFPDMPSKRSITFQEALNKGLLMVHTSVQELGDIDSMSVKSDTFSEMVIKKLDWLSSTKAVSASLDSLIQNVKKDQSGFKIGTLFDAVEKGLYDHKDGLLKDSFTHKSMKIKDAVHSGWINSKAKEIVDPRSNECISLEEAVNRNLINVDSGRYRNPITNIEMSLETAKEVGYIIKSEDHLQSKSSVEIYVEEILSSEQTLGKNKLQDAFATGVLNRSKSQVIDPDTVKPITIRRAGSLGMIDVKTGEFKNPQTGESCTLSDAVQKGFILSPKGLSLYSAVNQGLYCEETGIFKDPVSGKELTLQDMVKQDIITDACVEIRDVTHDGSLIVMKEAVKRGVIDAEKGQYVSEYLKLNFKEAISAGLIISNIPREGLRESSNNVQTVIATKPHEIWKARIPNREMIKDGPTVNFVAKEAKKIDDSKVTSSTSSMDTNSSGYETNASQNPNYQEEDVKFAVEIDYLQSKQVYLDVKDDVNVHRGINEVAKTLNKNESVPVVTKDKIDGNVTTDENNKLILLAVPKQVDDVNQNTDENEKPLVHFETETGDEMKRKHNTCVIRAVTENIAYNKDDNNEHEDLNKSTDKNIGHSAVEGHNNKKNIVNIAKLDNEINSLETDPDDVNNVVEDNKYDAVTNDSPKLIEHLILSEQDGKVDHGLNLPSPVQGHKSVVSPVRIKEFTFHAGLPQSLVEERQVWFWHVLVSSCLCCS